MPVISPPPLISTLDLTPIYPMRKPSVNFGAAIISVLVATACSPANSAPPNDASIAAKPASTSSKAPDPLVTAADHGRIMGDTSARTWVVIASDFQCPFCREWHEESYRNFVAEYVRTKKVKVAYLNFPLGQHQNAVPAAQAAMCASAQDKFWQFHDALFETQKQWEEMQNPRPVMDSIAKTVGVDFDSWSKCVTSDKMLPLIFADRDRAAAAGVSSTPSFLIGGKVIAGAVPFNELKPVLDAAIVKDKGSPST
jgi:protein-disulfide isomerase